MPGACDAAIAGQNTFNKRRAIVGALCAQSLSLSSGVHKQDLAIFDTFNLNLLLGAGREGERREALELVFLRHWSVDGERSC